MDYSLPGSSVHGIFQARVLEWGATAFSNNSQYVEAIQVLINRQPDREDAVRVCVCVCVYKHTHNEILLNHKTNEILPFAETQVGLENIMLCEINQIKKEK